MEFIYIINIFFYFFIIFYKINFLSKYFQEKYLNPLWIQFIFIIPIEIFKVLLGPAFILDKGLFDKYYNYAILMSNVEASINFIIMYSVFKFIPTFIYKTDTNMLNEISRNRLLKVSILFYAIFILFFYQLAQNSFGIFNWINNPREGYQFHRVGVGFLWAIAISCLSISFTLSALFIKSTRNLFIFFPFFIVSAFLLGSKVILLDFGIFFIIVLWLKKYPYFKLNLFIGVPLIILLMAFNFINGLNGDQENGLLNFVDYFDYYVNSTYYYEAFFKGEIPLFQGKIFISQFWQLVPRGLFPEKPFVYGVLHINEFFFPGAAEATHTPAFGGPIAYYGDFGVMGVVIFTLINPLNFISYFFMSQLFKNYNYHSITQNKYILYYFLWFTAPSFLLQIPFPLNIIFFLIVIFTIYIFTKTKLVIVS